MPPPRLDLVRLRSGPVGPIDLQLDAGTVTCLVGRSGSGKSVLLRMIADLDPHDGDVLLDGRSRAAWPAPAWRRQVVYQAAEPAWWAPTAAAHVEPGERELFVERLPRLGLDPALAEREIALLSTGERQRLALLRSLSRQPRALLLDEPTAALDEATAIAVEALVAAEAQAGLTVLWVTHAPAQAARLGARCLALRDGALHPA